jgi:cytochrome P450
MLLHPECQKKLQAELDAVNVDGRTTSMREIHNMPYFNAVWKESLRWSTPAPLGEWDGVVYYRDLTLCV